MSIKRGTPPKESEYVYTAAEIKKLIEESEQLIAQTKQLVREFEVILRSSQNRRESAAKMTVETRR